MQAFQTSVYCGLGIFHFFLAFDFWFSDLVSMWFSVFRMWVPLSIRSEQHWSQIAANWSQIAVKPLYPPLVTAGDQVGIWWLGCQNLLVLHAVFDIDPIFSGFSFLDDFFYGFVVSNRPQYLPQYASWHLDCILVVIVRWRVWLDTVYMQARMQ